jgi:hypothetical protein
MLVWQNTLVEDTNRESLSRKLEMNNWEIFKRHMSETHVYEAHLPEPRPVCRPTTIIRGTYMLDNYQ